MRYPLSLLAGLGITVAMLSLIWGLTAFHPPDQQLPQRVIRLPVAASMPAAEPPEPARPPIAPPSPPTPEPPPPLVEMQNDPIEPSNPLTPLPPLPEPSQALDLRVDLPGRPLLGPRPRTRPVRQPTRKTETATTAAPTAAPVATTAPSTASSSPAVDRPPSILANPRPSYPRRARRRHQQGEVKLRFTVTPVGKVRDIEVVWSRPPGVFDREAKRALARWRFAPALSGGEAVSTQVSQVIHFKLDR